MEETDVRGVVLIIEDIRGGPPLARSLGGPGPVVDKALTFSGCGGRLLVMLPRAVRDCPAPGGMCFSISPGGGHPPMQLPSSVTGGWGKSMSCRALRVYLSV